MSPLKAFLWRCVWAAIGVIVFLLVWPLILAMVGMGVTAGPAFALLRIALAILVILYIVFGPAPPAPF